MAEVAVDSAALQVVAAAVAEAIAEAAVVAAAEAAVAVVTAGADSFCDSAKTFSSLRLEELLPGSSGLLLMYGTTVNRGN